LNERQQEHAHCAELKLGDAKVAVPIEDMLSSDQTGRDSGLLRVGPMSAVGDTTAIEPPSIVAMCHKPTHAVQQGTFTDCNVSFDHLAGAQQERLWDCEPECLGGLQIEHRLKQGRLEYRQVGWLGAP
jgi:hypothetical protein